MNEQKEKRFLAIGLVSGAIITLFYDLFQSWIIPVSSSPLLIPNITIPILKTLCALLAILGGVIILKLLLKYLPEKNRV